LDDLAHHKSLRASHWPGRVIPTFRPDGVLDPLDPNFAANLAQLAKITDHSLDSFDSYLAALRMRRAEFIDCGATATDHAIDILHTEWLADPGPLYLSVAKGTATQEEARRFYGHMLIEMAQMSIEDGLVMQLHAGSRRNTNRTILDRFGRDMGADIPLTTDWVNGLDALLNRVGNSAKLRLILFTLDETTYARALAPMAGHWPLPADWATLVVSRQRQWDCTLF
jgi:glucuronate isomerase